MGTRSAYAATARIHRDTINCELCDGCGTECVLAQEVQAQIDAVTSKAIPPATG